MKKNILTLYLRLDSSAKSLSKRALAQLILKIIYSLEKTATIDQILTDVADIISTSISESKIKEAIESLIEDSKIEYHGEYLRIVPTKLTEIEATYHESVERQKRILQKYFSKAQSQSNFIQYWFESVTLSVFESYSADWISDLCKITDGSLKRRKDGILELVKFQTNKASGIIEEDKEWLIKKYINFLESDTDPDVVAILWDYGTSCFSSTLLTANTGADPISVDEFRDSVCILDTNVLMYLDLEGGEFKKSFTALENIFDQLNIKPTYFSITRDEFTRSMEFKKDSVIRVVDNYAQDLISEVKDPFLETAIKRGCVESEDYVAFFDNLLDIPKYFSDHLEIKNSTTKETDTAIEQGRNDAVLKEKINEAYKKKTNKDKRKNAVIHDAGLLSGATYLRANKEKCFILSRDNILNEVALDLPIRDETPIAVSLDTLINLFAIDNGGTGIDATNYAPLFANIVKLELVPERQVFRVEDLSWLLDIQNQISDLPKEEILDLAKQIHNSQRGGLKDEEIVLDINRTFQRIKLTLVGDLEAAKKEVFLEKEENEKLLKSKNKSNRLLFEQYKKELLGKHRKKLRVNQLLAFVIFPLLCCVIIHGIFYEIGKANQDLLIIELISLGLNIVAWFIVDFFFVNKIFNRRRKNYIENIDKEVEQRIISEMKDE